MAADWIKFEASTLDKAEVWQIAADLSIDPDAVLGKLLRVWVWFDQHTEEGNAPSVTKMLLDRQVGVTGFCDAMVGAGWMDDDGDSIGLPNFDRHNGETAKKRALTAKRVAKHKRRGNADGNAKVTPEVTPDALPREEKRREEGTTPHKPPKGGGQSVSADTIKSEFPSVPDELAREFLTYRKSKAPLTPTAWSRMVIEIRKSNMPPEDALSECMARGWRGLKAQWLERGGSNVRPHPTYREIPDASGERVSEADRVEAAIRRVREAEGR